MVLRCIFNSRNVKITMVYFQILREILGGFTWCSRLRSTEEKGGTANDPCGRVTLIWNRDLAEEQFSVKRMVDWRADGTTVLVWVGLRLTNPG